MEKEMDVSAKCQSTRRGLGAASTLGLAILLGAAAAAYDGASTSAAGPCDPPVANAIVCENSLPGAPESEWDVWNPDEDLEGFATQMSVNHGEQVQFKIKTSSTNYRIDVYRIGYYAGMGARKVATIQPSVSLPQSQPACLQDTSTGLVDCGNWAVSASWGVPANAVSGVYVAKLVREDPEDGRANHIIFVVRDDEGGSDLLVQTSDTTWQAYNSYGGNSLYSGQPDNRAYKVSYNRPFRTRNGPVIGGTESFFFNAEYPMIRWLEANGYDVSYFSGIDADRRGSEILEHRVFVSSGHDEYWSNAQRANVEAARNAGVNLAFFSGNEIFWKSRWEPSVDGTNTPYRTLVVYKETKADAKIDPSPEWTGTWRDPRFSPPSDGGRPENALTGQLFMVNGIGYWDMTVPAEAGKMRFWRDTTIANLGPNETATLPAGTLGYEWDEAVDNGVQPPGLVRLSQTTHDVTPLYLLDYGSTFGAGTATHSLTLYRHASGALVFGAGTVQWSWGLDDNHDGPGAAPDPRMQQATVNLLADMGAQPASLQPGLVQASASTDATPPNSQIASPAAGSTVISGTPIAITGTAADTGGRVGGVEVSTDGGATWHPASGRTTWSYSWTPDALGPVTIRTRAVDDSGNIESAGPGISVSVDFADCPCSVWDNSTVPPVPSTSDTQAVELGVKFRSQVDGYINGVRFYKGTSNTGSHTGSLWTATGTLLATAAFTNETATGWQEALFTTPVAITADTTYVVSYHTTSGGYAATQNFFATAGVTTLPLTALANGTDGPNGLYLYGSGGFPSQSYQSTNYWVDPVFNDLYIDSVPPGLSGHTPGANATQVPPATTVTASFSEPVAPGSISFSLKGPGNASVPAAVSYDDATRTASLQPSSELALSTTYVATITASDIAGNAMSAVTWSFTTVTCPCSIWADSFVPTGSTANDGQPVELGVKFRPEMDGWVTGVRFYKTSGNTGTHTGSLWTSTGTLLASATFTGESATGWQEVTFPAPVAVSTGTTYVVSYHNPNGSYLAAQAFFAGSAISAPPLVALANGDDGGNGVYRYGQSAFPNQSYNSSNYWVDVAFSAVMVDPIAPAVSVSTPAAGATRVPATTTMTARFTEPVVSSAISFVLRRPDGATVAATLAYDDGSRTATLTPVQQLDYGVTYTAALSGAEDPAGNVMAPLSWSFTTVQCPCRIWDNTTVPTGDQVSDLQPLELGVKFRSEVSGYVTGIRFYKGSGNTGAHTGSLWTTSGTLLATAAFQNESVSGWQEVLFASPVAVTANTTYVASYYNPAGSYIVERDTFASALAAWPLTLPSDIDAGGNGVFRVGASGFPDQSYRSSNYWIDVVFSIGEPGGGDTTPPVLSSIQANNIGIEDATISWSTDEPATTQVEYGLTAAYGSLAPAAAATTLVTTHVQSLTGLLPNAIYHYRVLSRDVAGNLSASADMTFTTLAPACPCTIWPASATPGTPSAPDTQPLELGVRFQSNMDGWITGIRFYKGAANTGTHVGNLWSSTGELLAAVTFTNETATGWQLVTFSAPVPITAGVTYVASYHTETGGYARDQFHFADGPVVNTPLRALQDGSGGGNGVFAPGASAFPTQSYSATNYWVDVVFVYSLGG